MKTIKILSLLIILAGLNFTACSQKTGSKYLTIVIKTSTKCEMCKERIEKALAYEKGIKSAVVDFKAKTVTVTYNPSKITPDAIRKAITKTGYDADNMPAEKTAYDKLPPCCKKDAPAH